MTRVLVAFVALVLAACGGPKPPAPASSGPRSEPAPPVITAPATPPAAAPAPQWTGPVPPVPPAASTTPAPADGTAPTPQVLYVKTHLANFREGAGTSRKILRVLRQGVRLQAAGDAHHLASGPARRRPGRLDRRVRHLGDGARDSRPRAAPARRVPPRRQGVTA